MELNLSSGRLDRSRGEVTRVPEEVDPGRAVALMRIVSLVKPPATRRLPARSPALTMSGFGSIGPTSRSMSLLACQPSASTAGTYPPQPSRSVALLSHGLQGSGPECLRPAHRAA